jgi:polyisoprenoid-binding protein YceI
MPQHITPLKRHFAAALCGLFLVIASYWAVMAPAHAQSARYELDPEHTTVAFLVDHIGYAKVLGMFRAVQGSYHFDETAVVLSEVSIEVDTASVFSNLRSRDDHLRGPDFLNSSQFPKMVFTSKGAQRTGERTFDVIGELELLGKKQPLTLNAVWNKSAVSPIGPFGRKPYLMGVSARGSFKRSDFGMNYAVANGWVGDEIPLIIEFEAIRK